MVDYLDRLRAWQHYPRVVCLLLAQLACLLILALRGTDPLQKLELTAFDYFLNWQTPATSHERIVLIGETDADLRRWGYPLSDGVLAAALRQLDSYPWAIGVDIYRDVPKPPGSEELDAVLRNNPDIIWVHRFQAAPDEPLIAPPALLKGTAQTGFSDILPDPDGVVRRGLLFLDDGQHSASSFTFMLAQRYLSRLGIVPAPDPVQAEHLRLNQTTMPPLAADEGGYVGADDRGYQFLLDYRDRPASFPRYNLSELLDGQIPPSALTNKIVLLGSMTESLRDDFYVPLSAPYGLSRVYPDAPPSKAHIYGVQLHALILSQLLRATLDNEPPLRGWPALAETLWIAGCCLIGCLLSLGRFPLGRFAAYTLLSLLVLAAGCYLLLVHRYWLPLTPAAVGLVLAATLTTAYLAAYEHAEEQLLRQLFNRFVAADVANAIWQQRTQLLESGRLRSQRLTATVLFTDIQGFTTIAEALEPDQLLDWLNAYLNAMDEVVKNYGGVVNKYIGDSVMAIFGVPLPRSTAATIAEDARQAVRCALAMGNALRRLNSLWQNQGLPLIKMRIGIHTGPLVAGSLGGSQRLEYTVLGDTVNIAARLESFSKDDLVTHPPGSVCRILIGESTRNALDEQFQTEPVGAVRLKGKQLAVSVYRVLDYVENKRPDR